MQRPSPSWVCQMHVLEEGRCVHQQVMHRCYNSDALASIALLICTPNVGAKDAQQVFNMVLTNDVIS